MNAFAIHVPHLSRPCMAYASNLSVATNDRDALHGVAENWLEYWDEKTAPMGEDIYGRKTRLAHYKPRYYSAWNAVEREFDLLMAGALPSEL